VIEVIFNRKARTLTWPVPGGSRTVEAFSEVRNELNGERPDPSRLPDIEHGIKSDRSVGPVVMPRPYPPGTFDIYGIETSAEQLTSPAKVLTSGNQWLDVWNVDQVTGQYAGKQGSQFSDWGYWIHFCNGSHHTDGCIGVVNLAEFKEFLAMVQNALDDGIPISVTCIET